MSDMNIVQEMIRNLPAAIWTLAGAVIWGCALATYVVAVEQRRRKRTDTPNDDWH